MDSLLDKIKGGLFGVATGDALGCTLEFLNEAQMKHFISQFGKHQEIKGGGPFYFDEGEVTDDTDMTICVSKGIIRNYEDPMGFIGEEFVAWIDSNPKDVGLTVRHSIINYHHVKDWEEASFLTHSSLNYKSAGNGSLMRCLPISLAYPDLRTISKISYKQSKLTHYDSLAADCCVRYNHIAYLLLKGYELKDSLQIVLEDTRFLYSLENKPSSVPDAYVLHTFEWMCYILYNTHSFEEAVVEAVNLGYDADTLGAVVGGLAGIYYGFDNIPKRFTTKLLCQEELESIADSLYKLRTTKE